jgi:hypothetical protein
VSFPHLSTKFAQYGEATSHYEDTIHLVKAFYESKNVSILTACLCLGGCKQKATIFEFESAMSCNFLFMNRTTAFRNNFVDNSIIYGNIIIKDLNMAIMKMDDSGMLRREEC